MRKVIRKKTAQALVIVMILTVFCFARGPFEAKGAELDYLGELNRLTGSDFPKEQYLTREDFCVAISKVFLKEPSDAELPFADLEDIEPESVKYLAALYESGILRGGAVDGVLYMLPDSEITRQEAFTLLGRVLDRTSDTELPFTDAELVPGYAYGYVSWFAENKILLGYPSGRLGPADTMTADQLAAFTIRTLEYKKKSDVKVATWFGTGSRGHADGGKETARFTLPYGVLPDKNGNLIVFDTYNNLIRRIAENKTETLVGAVKALDDNRFPKGYYSDGDISTALFNRPTGGVYNLKGELLVVDSRNSVIRILKDGKMYTFSGTKAGYSDGAAKVTKFDHPSAIAIDKSGVIYVADTLNNCIRKIDAAGVSSTVAGAPEKPGFKDGAVSEAMFLEPSGVAVSDDGKIIYVSDTGNNKIRKIENGQVTTIAGADTEEDEDGYQTGGFEDGDADKALFNRPAGLTLVDGMLIIADTGNNRIRILNQAGRVMTICGNGEPGDVNGSVLDAELDHPRGTCVHNGILYIADTTNNKIKTMPFDSSLYR